MGDENKTYNHRGNAGGEDAKLDTTNPMQPVGLKQASVGWVTCCPRV